MATTYFDDGSSISYDQGGNVSAVSEAPAGALLSDYGSNFNWSNINSLASTAGDVLKLGIGRVADYKTAKLTAQNPNVNYAQPLATVPGQISTGTVLLLAGAAIVFMLVSGGGKG